MPGLKKIVVPAPITFVDPGTNEPIKGPENQPLELTFRTTIVRFLNHESFRESLVSLASGLAILKALDSAPTPGNELILAQDDWDLLVKAMQTGFKECLGLKSTLLEIQALPHLQAVLQAAE